MDILLKYIMFPREYRQELVDEVRKKQTLIFDKPYEMISYICKLVLTESSSDAIETLSEIAKLNKSFFEDDTVISLVIKALHDNDINIETSRLNLFEGKFKAKLNTIGILLNPNRQHDLLEDIDFLSDFQNITTGNWLIKFLPYNYHILDKFDIDENILIESFNRLDKVTTFDYRRGIKSYGCYVSYYGLNNVTPFIERISYRKAMISIELDGSVYSEMKSVMGDDIDYIIELCKLRGMGSE